MTFDQRIVRFAERFLSERTFQLIVAPAVADLQYECEDDGGVPVRNRIAVLAAVAGAVRSDFSRVSGDMLMLSLVPASYYILFLIMCFDVFSISLTRDFVFISLLLLVLSVAPVMACFWPEPHRARPTE